WPWQKLVVHGELADLGPQPGDLVVPVVRRSALRRGLAAGQEVFSPAGEGGEGDPELARDEFQVFAAEEAEDGYLGVGGEGAALAGVRGVGQIGWFPGLAATMSRRDVQRNPGAECSLIDGTFGFGKD